MKDYQVELTATGFMTQMPDSQKVFGALVYLFAEKYGDKNATRLTQAVLNKQIQLKLSNLMPYGYLPTPQEYLMDLMIQNQKQEDTLSRKAAYTCMKERDYITFRGLEQAMVEPESCVEIFPYVKCDIRQQQRASIDSVRYNIPGMESQLYSVPTILLTEISCNEKGERKEKPVSKFMFYLQVDDSQLNNDLVDMLKESTRIERVLILGKRSSQGLNVFKISKVIKQEQGSGSGKRYLNMGMLLPDKIDYRFSILKIFTSERRPFAMPGGWNKNAQKYYISFIEQGSIISAPDGVSHAGKSVESQFNKARDIVFGNAYLYPMPLNGRMI